MLKTVLIDNGVVVPVFVTPNGKDEENVIFKKSNMFKKYNKKYTFLHISTCIDRKGINELLKAYFQGFYK